MQSVVAGHLSLYITLVLRGEWTKARAKKKSDGGSEQLGTHVSSTPSTGAAALALCRPDTAPSSRRGVSVLTPSLPFPPILPPLVSSSGVFAVFSLNQVMNLRLSLVSESTPPKHFREQFPTLVRLPASPRRL